MPEINTNINKTVDEIVDKSVVRTEHRGCKDLWWSSSPMLAKPPEPVFQGHLWVAFEYLQGRRFQKLGCVPMLRHPFCKSVSWCWSLLCFSLCQLSLVLSLGTAEDPGSSSLHAPFRVLYTVMRSCLSLLFSRPNSSLSSQPLLTGEMVQLLDHLCGPSVNRCDGNR